MDDRIGRLKERINKFDIEFKHVTKDDLSIQVGMEPVTHLIHTNIEKNIHVTSFEGDAMQDEWGKAAIGIYTLDTSIDDDVLSEFKGGTMLFHTVVGEGYFVGNVFKEKEE